MARVNIQPFPVGTILIKASEESIATAQTQFGDPKMEAARRALARALAERAKASIEQQARRLQFRQTPQSAAMANTV